MRFHATKENVKIVGRTTKVGDTLYLGYSASYIEFEFVGTKAEISICSDGFNGDRILKGWAAVLIDDETKPSKLFELNNPRETFVLYESKEKKKTKIKVLKRSEAAFGSMGIEWIETDSDCITPTPHQERRIEIIGDSITCGYGVEGICEKDLFNTCQENPLNAYSVKTAQNLDAEYHLVSWSGIGIISNWVPETEDKPLDGWLMPMLYQYTDASLEDRLHLPREQWNFQQYVPDLIVINIGTNDSSFTRGIKEREEWFAREYYKFLTYVHEKNPDTPILCAYGVMDQSLCAVEELLIQRFGKEHPDSKMYYLHFPLQKDEDGKGADYHPSKITHQQMTDCLTKKIREIMGW